MVDSSLGKLSTLGILAAPLLVLIDIVLRLVGLCMMNFCWVWFFLFFLHNDVLTQNGF